LASAGYFFPVLKATEVVAGLLLLTGIAAPVALVVLAPITLQIFLFHAALTPGLQNSVLPLVMIALHLVSATGFWAQYKPLFAKRSALVPANESAKRETRSVEVA
jgi:Na+/H+-translocating membrane pyrophosphatase